jgi:hypothetical protein
VYPLPRFGSRVGTEQVDFAAATADNDSPEEILQATRQLLALMIRQNDIPPKDVASAIFSTTSDLCVEFPALTTWQGRSENRAKEGLTAKDAEDAEEEKSLQIVDHSGDAVFWMNNVEVYQQSELLAAELQVGEQLGFVDRNDLSD